MLEGCCKPDRRVSRSRASCFIICYENKDSVYPRIRANWHPLSNTECDKKWGFETGGRQLAHYVKYLGLLTCSTDCYAGETTNNSALDKGTLSSSTLDSWYSFREILIQSVL